ncbi:hypothetical protein BD560DRAFT_390629 [Blakeslea trispora]|nr:hypothetical protein BD560DRAFT_390622 [Blakeslea trispora]KAI8377278.1 hypothetical protein BD560DRAFT_390629 [Blakeslea trispora]
MKEAFGEELLKQFRKEKRLSLFGKPARICSNIKQELDDVLLEYDENRDKDELEEGLFMLKKKTNGATARTLKTIMLLLDHMSEKKGVMTEMRLQSGLITALCHVFKPNTSHDVVGYNKVLFPASVAAKNCRPDIIVEVVSPKALVNVVGEVKCASAPKESVALDLFRLGVFGVEMLFEYNLKSSIVFQAVGNELVFFVCFLFSGFCVMLEVESLILPSTYDEFANFGLQSHKLQNIASLYEMCCVEDSNNAARKWHKFSYDVIKNIYSICSTTRTSTVHRSEASSEV